MARLDNYLKAASARRASDLHFASGEVTRIRVDGELVELEKNALESKEIQEIFFEILTDTERQKFLSTKNLDKSYTSAGLGNFRVNIFNTRRGISAVLRTIPSKTPTLETLGLPPVVGTLCDLDKGLVLVTGPTGSGKSTTLAAMINYINETYKSHILTVEDPVEFVHESKKSLINQREIGSSCLSFNDALKYALREDPDVILIGEMRDLETISLALTAAETGHLVFGTLHTRGAGASVDRIIDSFPANQQAMIRTMLAESLGAVISQTLVKRASGEGRVAAYEILVVNHAVSNLIREGKTFQIGSIMQTGRKEGMVLMDQSFIDLVNAKVILPEEAAMYMENPSVLGGKFAQPNKKLTEKSGNTNSGIAAKPASVATSTGTGLNQANTNSVAAKTAPPPVSTSAPKPMPPPPPTSLKSSPAAAPAVTAQKAAPTLPGKSVSFAPLKVTEETMEHALNQNKPQVAPPPVPPLGATKKAPALPVAPAATAVKSEEAPIVEEIKFDMDVSESGEDVELDSGPGNHTQEINAELKNFLGDDIDFSDEDLEVGDPKKKVG